MLKPPSPAICSRRLGDRRNQDRTDPAMSPHVPSLTIVKPLAHNVGERSSVPLLRRVQSRSYVATMAESPPDVSGGPETPASSVRFENG